MKTQSTNSDLVVAEVVVHRNFLELSLGRLATTETEDAAEAGDQKEYRSCYCDQNGTPERNCKNGGFGGHSVLKNCVSWWYENTAWLFYV